MADGFLGRWSRRKQEERAGQPLAAEPATPAARPPGPGSNLAPATATALPAAPARPAGARPHESGPEGAVDVPLPTLEDVKMLTPTSDFKPFVAQGVAPEVKNAAMKKLFTDPHYNVMDGLDIYIDDYSKPDPLPASMLRQMVSAQFLNLFDEEKSDPQALPGQANPPTAAQPAMPGAQNEPTTPASPELTTEDHAHTDLRLQPNHAAGPQDPGRGTQ
jgi:hypothetical protein